MMKKAKMILMSSGLLLLANAILALANANCEGGNCSGGCSCGTKTKKVCDVTDFI